MGGTSQLLQPHPPSNGKASVSVAIKAKPLKVLPATDQQLPTESKKGEDNQDDDDGEEKDEDDVQEEGERMMRVCALVRMCAGRPLQTLPHPPPTIPLPCTAVPRQEWPVPDSLLR